MSLHVWQLVKNPNDPEVLNICDACDRSKVFPTCPLEVRKVCCSSQRADREDRILKKI